jgi:hypothetical protein
MTPNAQKLTAVSVLAAALWAVPYDPVQASQDNLCGDPPPVANEVLKGEIQGEAQLLSRFVGDASLSGRIEHSRTEIFSKYGANERSDAFFEYMLCVLIMNDTEMTTREKIRELSNVQRQFERPPASSAKSTDTSIRGDKNVVGSKNVIIGDHNKLNASE